MEGVVLLIVAAYAAKIMIEDLSFAVRGRPSPRQAVRMARANAQSNRGSSGAFRGYLGDVWADAWTDASRRHRQRHERRQSRPPKQKRPTGPARTYLRNRAGGTHARASRRWAAGWERAESRHQQRQQRRRQQPAAASAKPTALAEDRSSPVVATPMASANAPALTRQRASVGATDTAGGASTQTPEGEPSGTTTTPTTEGEDDMSMPNGEVTGLRSAISYAEELAGQADEAVTALETLSAGLQSGGTGGNTIGKFTAAGEHLGAAAAQLRDAARELTQQLSVTEAYEANPDAGEKSFVIAD